MGNIAIVIRIFLLAISFYGYIQFTQRKVCMELSIGLVFCTIGSTLFFAGILNILPETSWGIFLYGILLAVRSISHKDNRKRFLSAGTIFFLVSAVVFFFLLHGSKFTHYDNFSHWALAPKIMIASDRFPNFNDRYFYFTSYPLGSSVFVYYITEIAGLTSEWFQMYAQALLMLGMVVGLFAFCNRISSIFLSLLGGVILLCSNTGFTDLLVDTSLPLTGLAGILFCIYYRDCMEDKMLYLIPYTVFLISIKNSGIFFVVFILCYAFFCAKAWKSSVILWAAIPLAPLLTLFLWKKHTAQVFLDSSISKHSMSITNFSTVFQGKSQDEIYSIISQIFQKTFTLSNPGILLLLVGFGIWCIWKSACKHPTKVLKEILFLIMASYLVYQIGMLAMYLFSMPGEEAMSLAGYSRYHKTILTFITGLILAETLLVSQELTARYQHQLFSISLSVLVLLVLFQATEPNLSYLHKQTLAGTEREKFDYLVEGYGVLPKSRYAVIVSNIRHDFGYLDHLIAYSLNPQSYTILQDTNLKDTNWSEYDYIIVYEETENARAYLSEHFPETTEPVVYLNLYHH